MKSNKLGHRQKQQIRMLPSIGTPDPMLALDLLKAAYIRRSLAEDKHLTKDKTTRR